MPPINRESGGNPRPIAIYVFLGAAMFAFIQSYSLLSPILLSFPFWARSSAQFRHYCYLWAKGA